MFHAVPRTRPILSLALGVALSAPAAGCGRKAPAEGSAAAPAAATAATTNTAPSVKAGPPPAQVAAVLKALQQQLGAELKGAMARGGPVEAVSACNLRAPAIAATVSRPGLRVGRTSHRLRNPNNAAPAWAADAVAALPGKRLDKIPAQQTFDLGEGKHGYLEVILTGELCLSCHGPSDGLDAGLKSKLAELYPSDAATGFAKGDVRGFFWAEYDDTVATADTEH